MAFTEADRVKIRKYLCFPNLYVQADPRLESAITTVQSIADGGSRPDNSAELDIKATLTKLATIETQLEVLWAPALATRADDVSLDVGRGQAILYKDGRRLINALSASLNTRPCRDYFSAAPISEGFHPGVASPIAGYEA